MSILLDTNAYTAWKLGHEATLLRVQGAENIIFSAVVVGELLFGFRHGSRYEKNHSELQTFLSSPYVSIVPVTMNSADRFGRVAAALRRKGSPIPTNDVWIAAHAMETGAELLTFDAHFESVDGLAWSHLR